MNDIQFKMEGFIKIIEYDSFHYLGFHFQMLIAMRNFY